MYVQSTNIATPKTIAWCNQDIKTGIYKTPTTKSIFLAKEGVQEDHIADKEVHGGIHKACYLFSTDHYPYWKKLYANLEWNWGMFGENLTVNGMNELQIKVGDIYSIGNAIVQVTQPREPCFKFGVKFGSQHVLKQFIQHGFPGTYVKVLEEGSVTTHDKLKLENRLSESLSVAQLFELFFSKNKNLKWLNIALNSSVLSDNFKKQLHITSQ